MFRGKVARALSSSLIIYVHCYGCMDLHLPPVMCLNEVSGDRWVYSVYAPKIKINGVCLLYTWYEVIQVISILITVINVALNTTFL
jgi:hypothetical protein